MAPNEPKKSRSIFALVVVALVAVALVALLPLLKQPKPSAPTASSHATPAPITATTATSLAKTTEVLGNPADLPPPGTRSTFDYVLKENGGIPYPFEKLVEVIASYTKEGEKPIGLHLPQGRSLVKAQGDFELPRIVTAVNAEPPELEGDLGLPLKERLYIGFIERSHQLEVISYNEMAGRFEFQLVEDYREGGTPHVLYASRALCTSCHQNQAPIFPVRPWDETSGQAHIYNRILEARQETNREALYHGIPIVQTLNVPESYDSLVSNSSMLVTAQKIWQEGCGGERPEGLECRRLMLQLALQFAWEPGNFDKTSASYQKLLHLQQTLWPAEGIAVETASIPNRNPLEEINQGTDLKSLIAQIMPSESTGDKKLDQLAKLPAELDPLTKRPPKQVLGADSDEGIYNTAQFFTHNDIRWLQKATDYDFQKIVMALESQEMQANWGNLPVRRVPLMLSLLKALGVSELPKSCCDTDKGMSPPQVMAPQPLAMAADSKLHLFQKYCFACHRGNPAARLDFMSGDHEAEVWEKMKDTPEIKEVLSWEKYQGKSGEGKMMPPKDSYQRQQLEAALAGGQNDRQAMIEALPSFLF